MTAYRCFKLNLSHFQITYDIFFMVLSKEIKNFDLVAQGWISGLYREIVPAGTVQIVPETIENRPFSMAMGTISRVIYTETNIRVSFFLSQFLILLLI